MPLFVSMKDMQYTFEIAYKEHADALFRYCLLRVNDRDMAKDMVQETLMRTWNYLVRGKEVSNMKSFFYRTLHNIIIDMYRKKKSVSLEKMYDEEGFEPSVDERTAIADHFDGREAVSLLQKVPESYRDVLIMRYIQELDLREIAVVTGESENTVSVRIHRGIEKLRNIYNHE